MRGMLEAVVVRGVTFYRSPLLTRVGVPHAFSTRVGGVSDGPFASLNLGNPSTGDLRDPATNIDENWRRLAGASGIGDRPIRRVSQVHGCGVIDADARTDLSTTTADAIVTRDSSCAAAVRIADCVPILLSSDDGKAVAAVHAGWRGVVAGVLPATLRHMRRHGASNIIAAIGPCIGFDAFEVGPEVVTTFENLFPSNPPVNLNENGKGRIDLRDAVRRQLLDAGVTPENIDTTDRCTVRDADEFFSHRRDAGLTGRLAAAIAPA
jgi:hypothetical protein